MADHDTLPLQEKFFHKQYFEKKEKNEKKRKIEQSSDNK
jgi:hypothetical protein